MGAHPFHPDSSRFIQQHAVSPTCYSSAPQYTVLLSSQLHFSPVHTPLRVDPQIPHMHFHWVSHLDLPLWLYHVELFRDLGRNGRFRLWSNHRVDHAVGQRARCHGNRAVVVAPWFVPCHCVYSALFRYSAHSVVVCV